MKTYATGELGDDIVTRIAKTLSIQEAQVRELWEGRFVRTAVLEDGVLKTPPLLTAPQTACYGEGTWLRDGVMGNTGVPRTTASTTSGRRRQRQTGTGTSGLVLQDPQQSDDPEAWWAALTNEARLGILRAFAGEHLFKVRPPQGKLCPECSGRGAIVVPGGAEPKRCPICRGLKNLVTITYE